MVIPVNWQEKVRASTQKQAQLLINSKQSKRISVAGHLQYFSHWDIPFGMNPVLEQSFIAIEEKKTFPMHFRNLEF